MPELPEVETVKNILKPILINRKIVSIDILRNSTIHSSLDSFEKDLKNETFLDITRKGKFLFFHLTNEKVIISHLRMEGKYYEFDEKENNSKYARVVFHLDNNKKVCYDDSRCFGMLYLSDENNYLLHKEVSKLGLEPFEIKDVNYLIQRTNKSNLPIKTTLLDQSLMTGLGNIYADEVLFKSKIHPLTPAKLIDKKEWENILNNSILILNEAIKQGGSTIKSYHPGKNISGNFQSKLNAYGRKNKDCYICIHQMRYIRVNGRGTTFCPYCQKKKGSPIKVAIFGQIASGKSSVLKAFEEEGIYTISCDKIVDNLYEKKEVIENINKVLGTSFIQKVDKSMLRKIIIENPKNQIKLEKIVHPLVRKEIQTTFINQKEDIFVVEVPLLFESNFDNEFDVIIGICADEKTRFSRLKKRNPDKFIDLSIINKDVNFEKNKKKAEFIIKNDAGFIELNKEVINIINILKDRLN